MPIEPYADQWDPGLAVGTYHPEVAARFIDAARIMRDELRGQYLEVILIDAPEKMHNSHKIRVAVGRNPEWYRDLWNEHAYERLSKHRRGKPASLVKRRRVSKSLDSIVHAKDKPYDEHRNGVVRHSNYYVSLVRDILYSRLTGGFRYRPERDSPAIEVSADPLSVWYFQRSLPPDAVTDEIRDAVFRAVPDLSEEAVDVDF